MCQNKIETACPIIQMLLDERKEEEEKKHKDKRKSKDQNKVVYYHLLLQKLIWSKIAICNVNKKIDKANEKLFAI